MDIIISIIGKLGEILIEPIGRQCGYLKQYNNNIETLKEQVEIVEGLRKDVERDIDEAKRKGGVVIRKQVQGWIERVDKNLSDAEKILESAAKAKFHNLASRYELSKKAEKKTAAVKEMKEDGKFDRVSNPTPLRKTTFPANEEFVIFERTEKIIVEIMEALKGKEINFIGIYGTGGVGKTTLVEEIAIRAEEEKIFDRVSMAIVSQTVDLKNIQDQIAEMLQLGWEGAHTVQGRARRLHDELKDKKVLIILDDVWGSLELAEIGIPFGSVEKGCKIIVTTRRKQVCNTMVNAESSRSRKILHLDVLSKQESWNLLRKNAGDAIESPTVKSLAEEICTECGGLPLAVVTVGRAMRQRSPADWKAAVVELKKSRPVNIEGVDEKVYKSLKLSYDYLRGEEAKSIFKLCCLFPEDSNIPIKDLVTYGIGLGIFEDNVRIREASQRTHLIINNLKDSCLLLESYQYGTVRMHDVVRDVAKSLASDVYFVKEGGEEWPNMEKLKLCIGISTIQCTVDEYPSAWDSPNLQIWLMQRKYGLSLPPAIVLRGMKALKVLDKRAPNLSLIRYRRPTLMKLLPEFGCLTNLRTLIFMNYHLQGISVLSELKLLEILRLNGCESDEPLSAIGELINLKLLDLRRHYFPIPSNLIRRLHRLQELYLYKAVVPHHRFRDTNFHRRAVKLSELKSLSQLTILWIEIEHFESIPQGFTFPQLESFNISVGSSGLERRRRNCLFVSGPGQRISSNFEEEKRLENCFNSLLPSTNYLRLSSFNNLGEILTKSHLKQLKELQVWDCGSPEYIFGKENVPPFLRMLHLKDVRGLKQIWKGSASSENIDNIRLINIEGCNELNVIFHSSSIARGLVKLERLELSKCCELEAIVAQGQEEEETTDRDLVFPQLRTLSLMGLPKLASFGLESSSFNKLEELKVRDCDTPKYLFQNRRVPPSLGRLILKHMSGLEKIWKGTTTQYLNNIQYLEIEACSRLNFAFHSCVARGMVKLEELKLLMCSELKAIVAKDEEEEEEEEGTIIECELVFPSLKSLSLSHLPELTAFCMDNLCFKWPSLEEVKLYECPNMKTFTATASSSGTQSTPNLKMISINSSEIGLEGTDLNTVIQNHYKGKGAA